MMLLFVLFCPIKQNKMFVKFGSHGKNLVLALSFLKQTLMV